MQITAPMIRFGVHCLSFLNDCVLNIIVITKDIRKENRFRRKKRNPILRQAVVFSMNRRQAASFAIPSEVLEQMTINENISVVYDTHNNNYIWTEQHFSQQICCGDLIHFTAAMDRYISLFQKISVVYDTDNNNYIQIEQHC